MAFDWNSIEGYRDDMSADEKLALLDNMPAPEPAPEPVDDTPVETPPDKPEKKETSPASKPAPTKKPDKPLSPQEAAWKRERDKLTSENGNLRKEMRKYMSEQQAKAAELQAEMKAREEQLVAENEAKDAELEALRREKTLSNYQARFMGRSYDEALAKQAAEALADGNVDALFEVMAKRDVAFEKSLSAKHLAETPKPPAGDANSEEAKRQDRDNLRKLFGLPPIK